MRPLFASGACLALAVFAAAHPAVADPLPSLDMRTWRPSTDPNASLVLEPAMTPGPGVVSAFAFGHYELRPVTVHAAGGGAVVRPVEHEVGVDAGINVGLGRRLGLGVALPVFVYQTGDGALPTSGVGDLGLSLKATLLENQHGGFGLAALGYASVPLGERASFMTESAPTFTGRLLAEYTILIATFEASLGYKARVEPHTFPADGDRFGSELPWTLGLTTRPAATGLDPGNRQLIEIAAHGWLPVAPTAPFESARLAPVLLSLSDRVELGHHRDTYLLLGGEVGLDGAYGVPTVRGILGFGWTPRSHDFDHDGIDDDLDVCPGIAEDKDGFEDRDGCPDPDNDLDGVPDREDACPNVKGASSSDPRKNGCPP